ncbi:MAG TPA: ABC-F family ATP-binding cassette domain-containing protein [Bacillota bacterium]|nr:ABC-F family ATP-binding cassette domain-containing protein [Bacillota bacterium]HPE37931.1 ABC-F family ATP-binding cassette domain-containing protein [Bacillota bacterium]
MLDVSGVTLRFGGRTLFEDVNITFAKGNCYGIIGANGAGKSTFLRILSGELEPAKGYVSLGTNERMAVLEQDHFKYDQYTIRETVIMGHKRLYEIMKEKETLYSKPDFDDEDGVKLGALEDEFADMDGWSAESNAEMLLQGLGFTEEMYEHPMADLTGGQKVKVLLAQALFGNPDVLLLDEPTNYLDLDSCIWLENYLLDFENTVLVVSHDRHFLNQVCTHIVDIDYTKATLFQGNYDFWYEYTQLSLRQAKDQTKKVEARRKELQEFIQRFSANASKSKQATSRKKLLENLELPEVLQSSRRYPFISFTMDREIGNDCLFVKGLSKTVNGRKVLDQLYFTMERDDRIAFVGDDEVANTTLFSILAGEIEPDEGEFKWGITTTQSYLPKDNGAFFDGCELSLVDWLRQYSKDQNETYIRGFLGRMLFSGEEALKEASVLSGGEKVRCMLSRMMLSGSNVLILDDPTNHLDLESITAVNEGVKAFKGAILFTSHDHQFVDTIANRIIEITPNGVIDKRMSYDEYLEEKEKEKR